MRRIRRTLAGVATAIAAPGCTDFVKGCPDDLRLATEPAAVTLRVGAEVVARASALGCGGTRRLDETWRWRAEDTLVVRVDSVSGAIKGRLPGVTFVVPAGSRYGQGIPVHVTVIP